MTIREVKRESSIIASTRVSMITLAELDKYWMAQNRPMSTMSQLVAWSLDLLRDVLKQNNMITEEIASVREAHEHLTNRGLYQKSINKRSLFKIANAIRFESMREDGLDPQTEDPRGYRMVHKQSSVEPYPDKHDEAKERLDEIERALKRAREEKIKEAVENAKKNDNLRQKEIV
jgi:hypothetical protein